MKQEIVGYGESGMRLSRRKRGRPRRLLLTDREMEIFNRRRNNLPLESIGRSYEISRERVRQIVDAVGSRLNLPGIRCVVCKRPLWRKRASFRSKCADCRRRRGRCRRCGEEFPVHDRLYGYCGACRYETRPCVMCGKSVTRDRGRNTDSFRNKHWFCDRKCFGRYWGWGRKSNRGFQAAPPEAEI